MAPENPSSIPAPDLQPRPVRAGLRVEIGINDLVDFFVGYGENISSGGLFVATYRLLPVGTEVSLSFVLPDASTVFVHGVVRWLRDPADRMNSDVPPGMGIQFTDLGDAGVQLLQSYVSSRIPRPDGNG